MQYFYQQAEIQQGSYFEMPQYLQLLIKKMR